VSEQIDVFEPPAPPTGPLADVPTREQNKFAAYVEWRGSLRGATAWRWLQDRALGLLRSGVRRISVNALVEEGRRGLGVAINNTWRAWIADDLVRWDPRLLNLIERRRRRKRTT
jgi:hypothetical protein